MAGTAFAQVTTVGTNRSEVQENGRDNKAQVENAAEGNDRNSSLIVFSDNGNRSTVLQAGFDNVVAAQHQGDLNTSWIRQRGYRDSVTLVQAGNRNGAASISILIQALAFIPTGSQLWSSGEAQTPPRWCSEWDQHRHGQTGNCK